MSETNDDRQQPEEREEPEVGLVADEDLPEDLQPTDENPLAKDPDDSDDSGDSKDSEEETAGKKVEGMPDMGNPSPG